MEKENYKPYHMRKFFVHFFGVGMVLFAFSFSFFISTCNAQTDYAKAIETGKKLLNDSKWTEAENYFRTLTIPQPQTPQLGNLLYLYAYACFKNTNLVGAQLALDKLQEAEPNCFSNAEVALLKTHVLFSRKKWTQGFQFRFQQNGKIKDADDELLKEKYFAKVPQDTLLSLSKTFPEDAFLQQWLKEQGKFTSPESNSSTTEKPGKLQIGMFFNFQLASAKPEDKSSYAPILIDFYLGFREALQEFNAKNDSAVTLYVYDHAKNTKTLESQLKLPEVSQMDVLIGTGFTRGNELLSAFAGKNKIPLFMPLLAPKDKADPGTYAFSLQAPPEMVAAESAKWFATQHTSTKCGIVYGPDKKDTILAAAFKKQIQKLGHELLLYKKVGKNSAANLVKFLTQSGVDSSCYLLVPDNEDLVRTQLLSALGVLKLKIPVMASGDWLTESNPDLEAWEQYPVYFYHPDYLDISKDTALQFAKKYIQTNGIMPSWYSYKGYETAHLILESWWKWNKNLVFQARKEERIPSVLGAGYRFKTTTINELIPIYKIENRDVKMVYPEEQP